MKKTIFGLVLFASMAQASLITCDAGVVVTAGGSSPTVSCGTLTFDNFQVIDNTGGAPGIVDILSAQYDSVTGAVYLQLNPNLQANEDEQFLFTVWGGIDQVDLSVGGANASVNEEACANPIATAGPTAFLCTGPSGAVVAPLGDITVNSNAPDQPVFSTPFSTMSPVYIDKDIIAGPDGSLSDMSQSFEVPSQTAEPISLLLLGSGLIGLGILRKRMC